MPLYLRAISINIWNNVRYILVITALLVVTSAYVWAYQSNNGLADYPTLNKILSDGSEHSDQGAGEKENSFWAERYRGWFFYEHMLIEGEKVQEEKPKTVLTINWSEYKKLQAKEIRNVINELKELAITYPTENNVQNYMIAQKIATNKAVGFMNTWQKVLKKHPSLDETVKQPGSEYASYQLKLQQRNLIDSTIAKLSQDINVGIVLFFSKENYYSGIQMPIFNRFLESTRWQTYRYVDVDEYPEAAAEYGVETLPEIWLVFKGGRRERVSAGMRTADVIEHGVVTAYERISEQKILAEPFKYADNNTIIDFVSVVNNNEK